MANNRLHYPCQRVGISPPGGSSKTYQTIRGLQSVGTTLDFSLEQVFELGRLQIYENIEGIPNVEATTEKVLDGYCPVYVLATQSDDNGSAPASSSLIARSDGVCNMAISLFPETQDVATGTPPVQVEMSGLYISNVSYAVSTEGNATESCTLVGNNRVWVIGGETGNFVGYDTTEGTFGDGNVWSGTGLQPRSINGSGGVNRREDVVFGSGTSVSVLPRDIPGVTEYGISGLNMLSNGKYGVHVQDWNVSADFGREDIFELGQRANYYRFVSFPVEVTNTISVISTSGDLVSATENGIYGDDSGCGSRYNLMDQRIKLVMCEGLVVDCGSKNKLSNVSVSGGGTDGGNQTVEYTYINYNDFDVKHPQDPVVALRP